MKTEERIKVKEKVEKENLKKKKDEKEKPSDKNENETEAYKMKVGETQNGKKIEEKKSEKKSEADNFFDTKIIESETDIGKIEALRNGEKSVNNNIFKQPTRKFGKIEDDDRFWNSNFIFIFWNNQQKE